MYFVYVLQSQIHQKFYIGFTENPAQRLREHNTGDNTSTKHGRPWQLIYLEGYLNKLDALHREKFLKSGSGHHYLAKQLQNYFQVSEM